MCDMKSHKMGDTKTVRRSIALPRRLVEEVIRFAPPDAGHNWNRLVITALEEYATCRKRVQLEQAMSAMADDPAIRTEMRSMDKLFRKTEPDGLQ